MKKPFNLSKADITAAASLLAKLDPGFLPYELFVQIYRLTPAPIIQIIPLRITAHSKLETLLIKRPADDPMWPNLWHNPGTAIRAGDTFETVANRLLNEELGGVGTAKDLVFATNLFHTSNRGAEIVQVYWFVVSGNAKIGAFYDVDDLPKDIVTSEIAVIQTAVSDYLQKTGG